MMPDNVDASVVCETARLILRKFNDRDVESLLSFRGDPEVMRFSVTGPETRDDILQHGQWNARSGRVPPIGGIKNIRALMHDRGLRPLARAGPARLRP